MFGFSLRKSDVEQPHISVHRRGVAAVEAFQRGDADDALARAAAMEEAGLKVLTELDRMVAAAAGRQPDQGSGKARQPAASIAR